MKNIHINNRKGFTLIELLVVISIISLLVSIVMPSLGTARQLAQRAACMATLKSIGQAWNMYLDSNDRKWPTEDAHKNFIVPNPDEYKNGEFYLDGKKAYTLNEALKDFFPMNGWKCASNQGKDFYDSDGSSYMFFPADILLLASAGLPVNGTIIDTNAVIKACEDAADSAPIVTDIMADNGPHRISPNEDAMAGYVGVYHDSHVEISNKDTFSENLSKLSESLLGTSEDVPEL